MIPRSFRFIPSTLSSVKSPRARKTPRDWVTRIMNGKISTPASAPSRTSPHFSVMSSATAIESCSSVSAARSLKLSKVPMYQPARPKSVLPVK